jgi:8-oxo-dGTP pyrophosphatase MutT (NUDIX family)
MGNWQEKFRAILSVYLVLQREDGSVLLLLRKNTGYCDGQYGLPAGHVDGGETLHTAMIREAREEAGVELKEENLRLVHVMHRNCGDHERVDFFFLCRKWDGSPQNVEPEKCEKLSWYHPDSLPENIIDYYYQMFFEIKRGNLLSYFGWEHKF